ncbi:hydroxymethylglutaryl-CoA synthase [Vaginisenegalia massiliensis]|uniref:hydroxymethylglutaryl-CoA synthase n=1 Tax=Vaginisenegalia massiliensis TaxID=2058294 RepID=UPI000F5300C6|nr:hydroxymethylglutaryl-CoA synthase [Vaginisenegalia massiliensis]
MNKTVGIDKIGLHVPYNYLDMKDLAQARGIDPNKLIIGIGQEKMAVPMVCEDVVSMAANAANHILTKEDREQIDQIIFGTESGLDFSKSSSTYLHELLGIQPFAKSFEIKQACYGATAALQMACDYVRLRPDRKVLVIAADIARYGLSTSGEATQGAGAVALLISANPRILALDMSSISYTTNQFDFWRPHYSDVALVDGKYSIGIYQSVFNAIMHQAEVKMPESVKELKAIIFHLPFTKMGKKALDAFEIDESSVLTVQEKSQLLEKWRQAYPASITLNKQVGNIYTGSMFLSLISYLVYAQEAELTGKVALFSYGSGAVGELVFGEWVPGAKEVIDQETILNQLETRQALSIEDYERIFMEKVPQTDDVFEISDFPKRSGFYLTHVDHHRRQYQFVDRH